MIGKGKKFSVVVRAGGRAACSPAACSPAAVSPAVQLREKRENREKREKRAYRDRTRSNPQLYRRLLRLCFPIHRQGGLFLILFSLLISSCSPGTPPATTPEVVSVYSSLAAEPWLSELYDCAAGQSNVVLSRVDNPNTAQISVRIGEPRFLSSFAFQIDEEEIWIVTHRESPILNMGREEAQALFEGFGDPSVQIWVYPSDEDVQVVFDQFVMQGRSIASFAHVATSPEHMVNVLETERQAIGILPDTWVMKMEGGSHGIYHVATVPVLTLTDSEPQGVVKALIACLQK